MIFAALKRFLVILVAYLLAVVLAAAGAGIAIFLFSPDSEWSLSIFAIAGFAGIFIGLFVTIPSAVTILIAEHWRIRSIWYYVAFAVVAAVALGILVGKEWWLALVGAVLGIVVGYVYWFVAGRNAGFLKTPEAARAQIYLLLLLGSSAILFASGMAFFSAASAFN